MAASGGDSGLLQLIPSTRRRREARRSWGLAQRRPGRRLAAAGGDGQGGELSGERNREGEREPEEERRGARVPGGGGDLLIAGDGRRLRSRPAGARRWHRVASAAPPCCFFSRTKTTRR
jgi:hypothetical protein